jgi:predicted lipid-binding transport protein (Tim44 family)
MPPPPHPPWRWGSFIGGFAVGILGCLVLGLALSLVMGSGGRRIGPSFFIAYLPLLAAFAGGNVALERRRFNSRGYAVGVLISLGLNGLCCGLCASDNFRVGVMH